MRMRLKKWARPELDACQYFIGNPTENRGIWHSKFKSDQPLHIEVGCGKGQFCAQAGINNPNINYLAIDMIDSMLGVARRTISQTYEENNREVDNLLLSSYDVCKITDILSSDDAADRLYINFCNPWPKAKHNKRRLTYPRQLEQYKTFLKPDAQIHFKTDDDTLFDDSIEYFKQCGFDIIYLTRDLHNSGYSPNYVTEHEKMFSQEGINIKFLIARRATPADKVGFTNV